MRRLRNSMRSTGVIVANNAPVSSRHLRDSATASKVFFFVVINEFQRTHYTHRWITPSRCLEFGNEVNALRTLRRRVRQKGFLRNDATFATEDRRKGAQTCMGEKKNKVWPLSRSSISTAWG